MALRRTNDWRGWEFLVISLSVTALSIILFFAGRQLFNKLEKVEIFSMNTALQKVSSWGNFTVEQIDYKLEVEGQTDVDFRPLGGLLDQVQRRVEFVKGKSIFGFKVEALQAELSRLPWVEASSVARRFPNRVEVQLSLRQPYFVVRARDGWVLVDKSGSFLKSSASLSGAWAHLPRVIGLDHQLYGEASGMNRRFKKETKLLKSLAKISKSLRNRMGLKIRQVQIQENKWLNEPIFKMRVCSDSLQCFGLSLSPQSSSQDFTRLQAVLSRFLNEGRLVKSVRAEFDEQVVVVPGELQDG